MSRSMLLPAVFGLALAAMQLGCGSNQEVSWEDLKDKADALYQKG